MALELGVLDSDQAQRISDHLAAKERAVSVLAETVTGPELGVNDAARKSLAEWVRRDDLAEAVRNRLPEGAAADEAIDDAAYAPYLTRLRDELRARARDRLLAIPASFDFGQVPGLSNEMRERLSTAGPSDLDQASRVPGITPAALSALHFALARAAA
jgi:tRNA uridine 5-carboxymethylaminomethyl modification enzyme